MMITLGHHSFLSVCEMVKRERKSKIM